MATLEQVRQCRVCGHVWMARGAEVPKRCPSPECRSVCWARERKPNGGEMRKVESGGEVAGPPEPAAVEREDLIVDDDPFGLGIVEVATAVTVPEGMWDVAEIATAAGVPVDAVWQRALTEVKDSKARVLGGGRQVVLRSWAEGRIEKKKGRG